MSPIYNSAMDIEKEVSRLASLWAPRQRAFKEWYDLIKLTNNLAQDGMESVISSDPRTSYNMAGWLLTPRTPAFMVDTEGWDEEDTRKVGTLEIYANQQYTRMNRLTRGSLHGAAIDRLIKLMLATGWYCFASYPTDGGWSSAVWNPASAFPDYDSNGFMWKIARKYTISAQEANRKIALESQGDMVWQAPSTPWNFGNVTVSSMWWMEPDGTVRFSCVMNRHWACPAQITPFLGIPIHCGPVAGLPDDGALSPQWRAEVGQSMIAPIMDVQQNFNKMLTYLQQILRDTANPKYQEFARNSTVTPEELNKRGALFNYGTDERGIEAILGPPMPPEMRTHLFDLRGQIQRSTFSDMTFGNITQQVSSLLMSQVTSAAQQVLSPFQEAIKNVLGKAAKFNLDHMAVYGMKTHEGKLPTLPDNWDIELRYDIIVPGDFMQRISAARVANPTFRLANATLLDVLFPEVKNATEELGKVRVDDIAEDPIVHMLFLRVELQKMLLDARENGDEIFARMIEDSIARMERQLSGADQAAPTESLGQGFPGVRPEALPPAVQQLLGGE